MPAAAPHTDSLTGVAGEATVLPCGGDPARADPAAVTWHRRPTGGSTEPAVGAGFRLRGDGSLWLPRLEPAHEGRFTCTDAATDRLIAVYDLKVRPALEEADHIRAVNCYRSVPPHSLLDPH